MSDATGDSPSPVVGTAAAPPHRSAPVPGAFTLLLFIFFLSGAASLVYQVVWTRRLFLTLGATSLAISTILTAFMAGLAIGSLLAGRLIDRRGNPLLVYAVLELVIGVYGAFTPWLLDGIESVYLLVLRHADLPLWPSYLLRFALAFAVLIVPTGLMGATLPVLTRQVMERLGHFGRRLGLLYGINTFGAAAGVLLTGFSLITTFGLRGTIWFAALLNGFAAFLAWGLYRSLRERPAACVADPEAAGRGEDAPAEPDGEAVPPSRPAAREPSLAGRHAWVLAIAAGGGFASFLYEIAWTRVLTLVLGGAVQVFSMMLATFLVGLALGSFVLSRWIDRSRDLFLFFAAVEGLVGIVALALLPVFGELPWIYLRFFASVGDRHDLLTVFGFVLCFAVMIVPTFLIGVTFPVVGKLYARSLKSVGRRIGEVYFANTLGGIGGSFTAGFILIPLVGMEKTLIAASGINLACAVAAAFLGTSGRRHRMAVAGAIVAGGLLVFAAHPLTGEIPIVELKSVRSSPKAPAGWLNAARHLCMRCEKPAWHPSPLPEDGSLPAYRGFCETCVPEERRWQADEDRMAPHRFWNPRVITSGIHTYARHYMAHPDGRKLRRWFLEQRLLFYEEGINTVVTVSAYADQLQLRSLQVDGKTDASNLADYPTEVLLAALPLLMHPDPREVLVVGLGSGITAGTTTRFDEVHRVDAVEIEAAVARAALHFADSHGDVLPDPGRRPPHPGHPKLRLMIRDARHYAAVTQNRYDVVISEPSNPWMTGPSHLFTREHFRNLRRVTKEDGLAIQWMHTYSMTPDLIYSLVKTFREVFDHVILLGYAHRPGDLFMLGSSRPVAFDVRRLRERIARPAIRRELEKIDIPDVSNLIAMLCLRGEDLDRNLGILPGRPEVAATLARIPVNTDDFPVVEFEAPRHLHRRDTSLLVVKALFGLRDDPFPPLHPADDDTIRSLAICPILVRECQRVALARDAIRIAERGVRLHPHDRDLRARLSILYMQRWVATRDPALPGAIRSLERILIEQAPEDPKPHIRLGELASSLGAYDEAVRHYEKARSLGGDGSTFQLVLARAYAKLGRDDRAVEAFEAAARIDTDCVAAYDGLATIHARRGRPDQAIEALMRWWRREENTLKRNGIRARCEALRRAREVAPGPAGAGAALEGR